MNTEFSPNTGRADIISSMADGSSKPEQQVGRNEGVGRAEPPKTRLKSETWSVSRGVGSAKPVERRILSFEDENVRNTGGLVSRIQDEEKLVVYSDEVEALNKFLDTYSGEDELPGKRRFAERVVLAQQIFRSAEITDIPEGPTLEEKVAIAKVRQAGAEGEEPLGVAEVRKRVTAQITRKVEAKKLPKTKRERKTEPKEQEQALRIKNKDGGETIVVSSTKHMEVIPGEEVRRVFEENHLEEKPSAEFWDSVGILGRRKWLKEHNIIDSVAVPAPEFVALAGGATVFPDTSEPQIKTDEEELKRRLRFLYERESEAAAAGDVFDGNADREEIFGYLRDHFTEKHQRLAESPRVPFEVLRQQTIKDDLEQLVLIRSLERTLGDDDLFNASEFAQEQDRIHRELADYAASEEIIERLLFLNTKETALDQQEDDEANSLQRALNFQVDIVRPIATSQRGGFRLVNSLSNAILNAEIDAKSNDEVAGALERILPQVLRDEMKTLRNSHNQHFRNLESGMTATETSRLYGGMNEQVRQLKSQLSFGSIGFKGIDQNLFEYSQGRNEPRDKQGILEWKAAIISEGIEQESRRHADLGPPEDWHESMKNVENNLRNIESTDFTGDDLVAVRNNLQGIAGAIDLSNVREEEREAAQQMKTKIDEIRTAVIALYRLRTTLEASGMDPAKALELFGSDEWKDFTFKVYFERFFKDQNGHDFIELNSDGTEKKVQRVVEGVVIEEAQRFNMLDLAMKTYFKQLREERWNMNVAEDLTKFSDISRKLDQGQLDEILRTMGRDGKQGRPNVPFTEEEVAKIEAVRLQIHGRDTKGEWGNVGAMKSIISKWHRETNVLGAHGIDEDLESATYGEKFLDLRKKKLLGDLKGLLYEKYGGADKLSGEQKAVIDAKIADFEKVGLLAQVINNAYSLTWSWGAFSDYDGIRVWNPEIQWFTNSEGYEQKRLGAFVFSNYSDVYKGRMVDHFGEFLLDEKRGRPGTLERTLDVNYIFQKHMLGKRRGILGHNRMMTKIINDNLRNSGLEDSLIVDGEVKRVLGDEDSKFGKLLADRKANLDNVDKLDIAHSEFDDGWARGVAIEEMLDDGLVGLENIEWSKVFATEDANVSKFNMGDWWSDRNDTIRFFGSDAIQTYLRRPSTKNFLELMQKVFYSKREVRIHPWFKIVYPAQLEIGRHFKEWFNLSYDMSSREAETLLESAVEADDIDPLYERDMKNKYLGSLFRRKFDQAAETAFFIASERFVKDAWTWPFVSFAEFWKQFWKYLNTNFR